MSKSTNSITETTGEKAYKASQATEKVDTLDIAHAQKDSLEDHLYTCAHNHCEIFDEEEFFVCVYVTHDSILKNVKRFKYCALLFLPSPRPMQSCFLYSKRTDKFTYLWSLPDAKVMSIISTMKQVAPEWRSTKKWCDAFYNNEFWNTVRKHHGIEHLSEHEYLSLHHDELIKSAGDEVESFGPDSSDIPKVVAKEIE